MYFVFDIELHSSFQRPIDPGLETFTLQGGWRYISADNDLSGSLLYEACHFAVKDVETLKIKEYKGFATFKKSCFRRPEP